MAAFAPSPRADTPIQQFLPFNRPRLTDLRALPRKAFAYWHVWPVSVDNADPSVDWYQYNELSPLGNDGAYYGVGGRMRQRPLPRPIRTEADWQVRDMEDEVRRAAALGLDGFMISICSLADGSCWGEVGHVLQAAKNVDPGFKVIPTLDVASLFNDVGGTYTAADIADALASIANDPALFRTSDGRMVISATNAQQLPPSWWQSLRQQLSNRGVNVYLTLILINYNQKATYAPVADGLGPWGPSTPLTAFGTAERAADLHQDGKTYIAPARPQLNRPKNPSYAEAVNSETFRATMMDAINSDADWLFIYTWNDGTEGTEMRPSTGIQWSFYDLSAYYVTWFKTRQQPAITRDVLYYFHRIHWTSSQPDPVKQPVLFELWNDQPPTDEVELLAFLRSPGRLRITTSGGTYTKDAPAGITSFRAPLASGYPNFSLIRSGATRISMRSAFNVRDRIDWQDLLYRGGSSNRPVVEMVANPPVAP